MTEPPERDDAPPLEGEMGCAVVGTCLLLVLGLLQSYVLLTALVAPPARDGRGMGMESLAGVLFGLLFGGTGIALLVAASPGRIAPRALRLAAGIVGATLVLACAAAILRITL